MSETTPSSGSYPPAPRVRRAAPVAVTLVQGVSRTITIAGFPLSTWAFALRIWAAMMVALYAAFWLQLESASSAAVTVAILARPTRGQAYQKAVYRILATIIGVVASIVIAGLFAQSRSLFVIGFAGWLGLCVYAGGLLDGNRAYSAVLSGYTVALVAMTQIDSPQNIFSAGVNRGAAIVVGIAALALISDVFAAPNVHTGLSGKLIAAHRRVRAFALAILRGESADPIQSASLLREITALHPDITALVAESSGGRARAAAARSAAVALVAEVSAAGALASLPANTLPSLRNAVGEALADGLGKESRALQLRLQQHADVGNADPHDALFVRHALDLLIENRRAQDAIEDLQAGRHPERRIHAPIYRSRRAAARNGLRAFLAVLISAILFCLGGWPFASLGLALVGLTIAFLVLVFFVVILSPTNPQVYNPETYLFSSFMAITSVIMLFVVLWTVLPTSDALRRHWYLTSARAEMRDLLAGGRSRRLDHEALFRDADRIGQLAALQPADDDERRDDLGQALEIFGRAAAVRRVRTTLAELSARTGGRLVGDGYSALAGCDPLGLRQAAADLANAGAQLDRDGQTAARAASLDLIWVAFLIDASTFAQHRRTTS